MENISYKKIVIFSLFTNVFWLFVNVFTLVRHSKKKNQILSIFKNIDNIILTFALNSYLEISSYLNNKYRIEKIPNQKILKKTIKIYAVDVYSFFDIKKFIKITDKFIFDIDSNNPDYLFYSTVGNEHLNPKYANAIKIAFYSENSIIDFNQADYCIGNHNIIYLDRYFRYTRFILILTSIKKKKYNILSEVRQRVLKNNIRKKFCAAVISNIKPHFTDYFRLIFIEKLNLYKKVDMGGKFNNNVGGPIKNKIKFLSLYKFSIAMENTNGNGYTSEKILESFLSGTIPIYYGNYMVEEFINPKTYILIRGPRDIDKKIKYIKEIDNNNTLYKQILKEKVLIDKDIDIQFEKEKLDFFIHIFEQDKNKAKRK